MVAATHMKIADRREVTERSPSDSPSPVTGGCTTCDVDFRLVANTLRPRRATAAARLEASAEAGECKLAQVGSGMHPGLVSCVARLLPFAWPALTAVQSHRTSRATQSCADGH